uniref:Uncharacterized protein n=1 Tax=Romanomermis culicivorax TaxID=13658 RepID=A0A915KHG7_ROMCU
MLLFCGKRVPQYLWGLRATESLALNIASPYHHFLAVLCQPFDFRAVAPLFVSQPYCLIHFFVNPLGHVVQDALAAVLDQRLQNLEAQMNRKAAHTESTINEIRADVRKVLKFKRFTDLNHLIEEATFVEQEILWDGANVVFSPAASVDPLGGFILRRHRWTISAPRRGSQ